MSTHYALQDAGLFDSHKHDQDSAWRMLRLLVQEIEAANGMAFISDRHPLVRKARLLLEENDLSESSLALVTDLVWRVDNARYVLSKQRLEGSSAELIDLLDTSDIHAALRREP